LLSGDVSIQYQVQRYLYNNIDLSLRDRIANEGWGKAYLEKRESNGHWGLSFYQPKWTSTHYTLLDLKNLEISPSNELITISLQMILSNEKGSDGGINPSGSIAESDLCINGMALNYASYFLADEEDLKSIIDLIIDLQMADGGFNCCINRSGATHSSLHTTISVLEGILEYKISGYKYRIAELEKIEKEAVEFILEHKLFKSDKTGEIISRKMLMLSYPCRWYYDILRALEYLNKASFPYDKRMDDAIEVLLSKRRKDGTWPVQSKHPGATHIEMEKTGSPSRWNTLRAIKVLRYFNRFDT